MNARKRKRRSSIKTVQILRLYIRIESIAIWALVQLSICLIVSINAFAIVIMNWTSGLWQIARFNWAQHWTSKNPIARRFLFFVFFSLSISSNISKGMFLFIWQLNWLQSKTVDCEIWIHPRDTKKKNKFAHHQINAIMIQCRHFSLFLYTKHKEKEHRHPRA